MSKTTNKASTKSSAPKRRVAIGLLGPTLDRGAKSQRWEFWRPTVALCQHADLLFDRLELLHEKKYGELARVVAEDVRSVSPETEVRTHLVAWSDAWDFQEVYGALHDFARDYPFDTDAEDYLVHITTGTHVAQICLFLLTESRHVPGRLIQTSPPRRNRKLGPGTYSVIDLNLSKYDRIASRFRVEQYEGLSFLKSGIATRNEPFNGLIERIEKVTIASKAPVLLTGPTGAGKSLLARRIYELKRQRHLVDGPFVEVNCATIRGDAAMSALFGHTKGAFTGAVDKRPGLLKSAHGGVLFLDEIGELGLDEQAMLLRAVEDKVFLPVGADTEVASDFQLIAGTNRDLWADVRTRRFREDLLARINLWTFRLPGLAERPEDIEPNLSFELDAFARANGVHVTMSREAHRRFLDFAVSPDALWRANFRDFNAAVIRMATLAPGGRITLDCVQEEEGRLRAAWRDPDDESGGGATSTGVLEPFLGAAGVADLDRFDRVQLADVVRVCLSAKSLSEAGRRLFAVSRTRKASSNDADRLRKYLSRFGLSWSQLQKDGD